MAVNDVYPPLVVAMPVELEIVSASGILVAVDFLPSSSVVSLSADISQLNLFHCSKQHVDMLTNNYKSHDKAWRVARLV